MRHTKIRLCVQGISWHEYFILIFLGSEQSRKRVQHGGVYWNVILNLRERNTTQIVKTNHNSQENEWTWAKTDCHNQKMYFVLISKKIGYPNFCFIFGRSLDIPK